jgi:hypothetical protein
MMIIGGDALAAQSAVLSSQGLFYIAYGTVAEVYHDSIGRMIPLIFDSHYFSCADSLGS